MVANGVGDQILVKAEAASWRWPKASLYKYLVTDNNRQPDQGLPATAWLGVFVPKLESAILKALIALAIAYPLSAALYGLYFVVIGGSSAVTILWGGVAAIEFLASGGHPSGTLQQSGGGPSMWWLIELVAACTFALMTVFDHAARSRRH